MKNLMIMVDRTDQTRIRNDEKKNRMKHRSSVDAEIKASLERSRFQGRQILSMWLISVAIDHLCSFSFKNWPCVKQSPAD